MRSHPARVRGLKLGKLNCIIQRTLGLLDLIFRLYYDGLQKEKLRSYL
jgi:hypothetical protein